MMSSAVIVFREVLEASLVISVLLAAVRGLPRRGLWVGSGLAAGICGACAVAAGMGRLAELVDGRGQEIFEAGILFTAVAMLGWHNVWMAQHGRQLAARLKAVGKDVTEGGKPLSILFMVTALAVLREGSEVVLFLYGVAAAGARPVSMLAGGALGLAAGTGVGAALYFGLMRIPVRHLFRMTGWIILLMAAGMAARGAAFLTQAGLLPAIKSALWDSSGIVSAHGLWGTVLSTLVGYDPRPSVVQVVFYAATLLTIALLMRTVGRRRATGLSRSASAAVVAVLLGAVMTPVPGAAQAAEDYKIYSPVVVRGERDVEFRATYSADDSPARDGDQGYLFSLGKAFTDYWAAEIYAVFARPPGGSLHTAAVEWENQFQLAPQGKYWMDFGLLTELEVPTRSGNPTEFALTPVMEKQLGRALVTLNPVFERQFGSHAETGMVFLYRARLEYLMYPAFSPAIELHGEPGTVRKFGNLSNQRHQIGPAFYGIKRYSGRRSFRYSAALLFGITGGSPDTTLTTRFEYEF